MRRKEYEFVMKEWRFMILVQSFQAKYRCDLVQLLETKGIMRDCLQRLAYAVTQQRSSQFSAHNGYFGPEHLNSHH
jgi:hypothetical protein